MEAFVILSDLVGFIRYSAEALADLLKQKGVRERPRSNKELHLRELRIFFGLQYDSHLWQQTNKFE